MNKKGEGEQFNWIFVIVSGAIILGFFVMFTFKYIELQEKRQDVDTVRFLGSRVLGASANIQVGSGGAAVDSDENNGLRFGYNVELGSLCRNNESTILINKGSTAWYRLNDEVVFMNKDMKVNALDLWILPWYFPFHITNFLYLADPKTNFYFVFDQSTEESVKNLGVSSVFKAEEVAANQLSIKSNSKVVYFLSNQPNEIDVKRIKGNLTNVDFVYVDLRSNSADLMSNSASFFNSQTNTWSRAVRFYTTQENKGQLYGAIFSNDVDNFGCNVNRSLSRVEYVAGIYADRARLLGQIDRSPGCYYNEIAMSLDQYANGNFNLINILNNQNLMGAGCIWVYYL